MYETLIGWIGIFVGWIFTLLYMKGNLRKFPFYDRIISWIYQNPSTKALNDTEEFLTSLREAIVDQILNNQPQLFDAIAKQRIILANQEREPVAIFLSVSTFKMLLRATLSDGNDDDSTEVDSLYDAMQGLDIPIGHLGVLPVYVTELLINAPIFVSGGIRWKI